MDGERTRRLLSVDAGDDSLVGSGDDHGDSARSLVAFGPSRFANGGVSNEVVLVVKIDIRLLELGINVVLVIEGHGVLERREKTG